MKRALILGLLFSLVLLVSPAAALGEGLIEWTWDGIVWFVGYIPFIGPYLAFVMQLIAFLLSEITFSLYLIIWKYPTTVISLIIDLILLHSMEVGKSSVRRGLGYKAAMKMIITIANDLKQIYEFILSLLKLAWEAFVSIVNMIANIIKALKPI